MNHPEQYDDEFYLGNVDESRFYQCVGWKTKRLGNVPYNVNGDRMITSHLRPHFVKKSEVEEEDKDVYDRLIIDNESKTFNI